MVRVIKKLKTTAIYVATICFLAFPLTANAYSVSELNCLAKVGYHEAKGESTKGMIAVMQVTMNRVNSGNYPKTICGVVYQKSQFSWTKYNPPVKEKEQFVKAQRLAKEIVAGKHKDVTKGAVFFHTRGINPSWSRKLTCTTIIGGHKFFK